MTRTDAKDLLPIIQAFAEGKTIQRINSLGEWSDVTGDVLFYCNPEDYRIKPEPYYRPFKNQEECWNEMQKHQSLGWVKNACGHIFNITAIFKESIKLNESFTYYSDLCKHFKFMDGTPCGIKED